MIKKRHILVVDDDLLNAGALQAHFTSMGYDVTLAENCAEGRAALQDKPQIDLMILDHLLPDGRGTDLLQSMADVEGMQKPPVIMSSSLMHPQTAGWEALLQRLPEISQTLIQAFVPKPYSFENMDTVVDLIFEVSPQISSSNTILSGDYKHPRKK